MTTGKQTTGCLMKQVISLVLAITFGIVIALLLLEVGLRFIPQAQLDTWVERSSQRLALYRLDPRIGWSLRPAGTTEITTRDERSIPVRINSLGLRDTEHAYSKPPDVFRVLMLGDSFTEALDVELEESYPYLVEQCLTNKLDIPVEVINGGVSGYGPLEEYLFYQTEGIKYDPDIVIWMLYIGNDFTDLSRTVDQRLVAGFGGYRSVLREGELETSWISWEQPYPQDVSALELFLRRNFRLWRVLFHPESKIRLWLLGDRQVVFSRTQTTPSKETENLRLYFHTRDFATNDRLPHNLHQLWQGFGAVAGKLYKAVEDDQGQLVVVMLPVDYQVSSEKRMGLAEQFKTGERQFSDLDLTMDWAYDEPNQTMVQLFEEMQTPVLDLYPYLQEHYLAGGAPLYFSGIESHLNRDGQKLTAEIMCDWLLQNKSVGWPK